MVEKTKKNSEYPKERAKRAFKIIYYNLGVMYEIHGNYEKAERAYKSAIEIDKKYKEAYFGLGNVYDIQGNYEEAVKEYKKAIEIDKKYKEVYNNLGAVYDKQEKYKEAIEAYEEAIKIDGNSKEAYYNLGGVYAKWGNYREAERAYKSAIGIDENFKEVYYGLGVVYIKQGKYEEAIKAYKSAIEIDKNYKDAYNNLGFVYIKQGNYEEAIEVYKKVIEIDGKYKGAYYNLGNVYAEQEKYKEAIEAYKSEIEVDDKYKETYYNLGNVYVKQGNYEEAIEAYKSAIEIGEKYKGAYNNLGFVYAKGEKYKEAVKAYKKAIEIDKNYKEAYNNLGIVYYMDENYEEAIEAYKSAIEIDRGYKYAYLGLINVYIKKKKYKEAKYILNYMYKLDNINEELFKSELGLLAYIKDKELGKEIEDELLELALKIMNFKSMFKYKYDTGTKIVHYTRTQTLQHIIKITGKQENKPRFRLQNASQMNDPDEGEILLRVIKNGVKKQEDRLKKPSNVFLASFSKEQDDKESLPMWIHYADGAKGCAIQFDKNFFDKEDNYSDFINMDNSIESGTTKREDAVTNGENISMLIDHKYCLYEVMYINDDDLEKIKEIEKIEKIEKIKEIEKQKRIEEMKKTVGAEKMKKLKGIYDITKTSSKIDNGEDARVQDIINTCLDSIRFLVKHKDYEYERELRLVKVVPDYKNKDKVKIDLEDTNIFPPNLYIDVEKDFDYEKMEVTLGPKAEEKTKIANYLYYMGIGKVNDSKIKYK